MQLCFVSVHGPRETYCVDEPRIIGKKLKNESYFHGIYFLKRYQNISLITVILYIFFEDSLTPDHVRWSLCPHSMARPRVEDGGTASSYSCEYIE
jgi:hypothetical protein